MQVGCYSHLKREETVIERSNGLLGSFIINLPTCHHMAFSWLTFSLNSLRHQDRLGYDVGANTPNLRGLQGHRFLSCSRMRRPSQVCRASRARRRVTPSARTSAWQGQRPLTCSLALGLSTPRDMPFPWKKSGDVRRERGAAGVMGCQQRAPW